MVELFTRGLVESITRGLVGLITTGSVRGIGGGENSFESLAELTSNTNFHRKILLM